MLHEQSTGKGGGGHEGRPHLSGRAGSGRARRRAGAAAVTGTALPGTLKALRKAGPQAVGLLPLSKEVPPALPPLTSELLAGAIGRLRGSVVGWGLGRYSVPPAAAWQPWQGESFVRPARLCCHPVVLGCPHLGLTAPGGPCELCSRTAPASDPAPVGRLCWEGCPGCTDSCCLFKNFLGAPGWLSWLSL